MFHLEPPDGFRPFDPRGEIEFYQRHLPHWRQQGATYAVTFRLVDALPRSKLRELSAIKNEFRRSPEATQETLRKAAMAKIEKWLDAGSGECLLRDRGVRDIVSETLQAFDSRQYELGAFVIMPNHVHLLIRPLNSLALEDILKSRKQRSSRLINQRLGRTGALWQDESYDRIIRDAEHLWSALQYIGANPKMAGVDATKSLRWVSPSWKARGWQFED